MVTVAGSMVGVMGVSRWCGLRVLGSFNSGKSVSASKPATGEALCIALARAVSRGMSVHDIRVKVLFVRTYL